MMKKILQAMLVWILANRRKLLVVSVICAVISLPIVLVNILPDSTSGNQPATPNESSIQPVIEIRQQYSDLRTEHIKLQAEYVSLQLAYESTKQDANNINALLQNLTQASSTDDKQVASLQSQLTQLRAELPNLHVALRIVTDERATFERRFLNSQYEKTLLVDKIEEGRLIHQSLLDRIAEVTDRTDNTTTSNLAAEKRSHFYEMWDLWVETLKEEK